MASATSPRDSQRLEGDGAPDSPDVIEEEDAAPAETPPRPGGSVGNAMAPVEPPPTPEAKAKAGPRRGYRLHKQTEKMQKKLSTLKEKRETIHKLLKQSRSEEKVERQKMKRLWKKASKLDVATMVEIAEMKGLTIDTLVDYRSAEAGSAAAPANPAPEVPPAPPLPE